MPGTPASGLNLHSHSQPNSTVQASPKEDPPSKQVLGRHGGGEAGCHQGPLDFEKGIEAREAGTNLPQGYRAWRVVPEQKQEGEEAREEAWVTQAPAEPAGRGPACR